MLSTGVTFHSNLPISGTSCPSTVNILPRAKVTQQVCLLCCQPSTGIPEVQLLSQASAFTGCKVFALDAAMPFDFETKASARLRAQTSLRIGIVGFGTFGQFLAKRLVQQGHKVSLFLCSCHTHLQNICIDMFWASHDMHMLLT